MNTVDQKRELVVVKCSQSCYGSKKRPTWGVPDWNCSAQLLCPYAICDEWGG